MDNLIPKHQAVLDLILADPNGNHSAYYKSVYKCTDKAAIEGMCKLYKRPHFSKAMKARQDHISEKVDFTAEQLIRHAGEIALADPADFYDSGPDGGWMPKNLEDIPLEKRRAIESITVVTVEAPNGNMVTKASIRLCSKSKAMDFLGKAMGLYSADNVTNLVVNYSGLSITHAPSP